MKKVMASIGVKITKQTVGKVVTKAVPVLGGVMSGGITYVTFRPMGKRFADMLVKRANGDLDNDCLELNPEFLDKLKGTRPESMAADDAIAAQPEKDC